MFGIRPKQNKFGLIRAKRPEVAFAPVCFTPPILTTGNPLASPHDTERLTLFRILSLNGRITFRKHYVSSGLRGLAILICVDGEDSKDSVVAEDDACWTP